MKPINKESCYWWWNQIKIIIKRVNKDYKSHDIEMSIFKIRHVNHSFLDFHFYIKIFWVAEEWNKGKTEIILNTHKCSGCLRCLNPDVLFFFFENNADNWWCCVNSSLLTVVGVDDALAGASEAEKSVSIYILLPLNIQN